MNQARRSDGHHIGSALASLAAKECRSLHESLAQEKDDHRGIHDARRACRRLRCLLPLLADLPVAEQAAAIDKKLRRLVHGLSDLRDAHVAFRTAQRLASTHASLTPSLIGLLEDHSATLLAAAQEQDSGWKHRRHQAARISEAIHALPWQTITPSATKAALKQSKKRMKKTCRKAREQRTSEASHRWRRRARQLRYQLQLLRKARLMTGMDKSCMQQYEARIKRLGLLTDRLGWRQDVQVFLHALDQLPASAEVTALRAELSGKTSTSPRTRTDK
jgi:CHAD domain-containing protein